MMYIETKWCMFVWFVCVRLCLPSFRPLTKLFVLEFVIMSHHSAWIKAIEWSYCGQVYRERNRASQPSVLSAFLLMLSQNCRSNMNPVGTRVLCLFDNHCTIEIHLRKLK